MVLHLESMVSKARISALGRGDNDTEETSILHQGGDGRRVRCLGLGGETILMGTHGDGPRGIVFHQIIQYAAFFSEPFVMTHRLNEILIIGWSLKPFTLLQPIYLRTEKQGQRIFQIKQAKARANTRVSFKNFRGASYSSGIFQLFINSKNSESGGVSADQSPEH